MPDAPGEACEPEASARVAIGVVSPRRIADVPPAGDRSRTLRDSGCRLRSRPSWASWGDTRSLACGAEVLGGSKGTGPVEELEGRGPASGCGSVGGARAL